MGFPNFREKVLNLVTFHFGIVCTFSEQLSKPLSQMDCDAGSNQTKALSPAGTYCGTTHFS